MNGFSSNEQGAVPSERRERRERRQAGLGSLVAGAVLMVLWTGWALLARMPVIAESVEARVETGTASVEVAALEEGVVAAAALGAPGRRVNAGEVLLRLDTADLEAQLASVAGRREAIERRRAAANVERAAERQAMAEGRVVGRAATAELAAAARQAAVRSAYGAETLARSRRLAAAGLVAAADEARTRAEGEERRQTAAAASLAVEARAHEAAAATAAAQAGLARLAGEDEALAAQLAELQGEQARLALQRDRRTVRSPAAGRLAAVAVLGRGSRVARGARLAMVVPDDGKGLRVRGLFRGLVAGRLGLGQVAWVHLQGRSGRAEVVEGRVAGVDAVARRDGGWEALVSLPPEAWRGAAGDGQGAVAGVLCRVEVEVGRRTPAAWVLEFLGRAGGGD